MMFRKLQQMSWIHDLYQLGQSDALQEGSCEGFERILRHIVTGFGADSGSLALCQGDEDNYLHIVAGIDLPEGCIGKTIAKGTGIIGWVVENTQPLLLKGDIAADQRFRGYIPKTGAPIPSSALCWPLRLDNRVIGALCVNSFQDQADYCEDDLQNGQVLVNLITLVVDNARLHTEKQQRIEELATLNARYIASNEQLKVTHERLTRSEKRLNDILDSLDSVVWSMVPETLDVLYLNQAAKDVSGRAVEDFINDRHLWMSIIYPDDRARVQKSLVESINTGMQKITYRIVRPDGELRWLFQHMHVVYDKAGKAERIDGITVDVTQHKLNEDLLKQRNEELQLALDKIQEVQSHLLQSEKMASVGQLAAGVAHEINNPIGYINSNLTSLKDYVEDLLALLAKYEQAEAVCADAGRLAEINAFKRQMDLAFVKSDVLDLLAESHEGAFRVKKIVQDLKDFSHAGGEDDWQWVSLHAGLESTLNIVNNEIKYKAHVVKDFGDIPEVRCLPHQLNQVFMNLLVNAAHAIDQEGTITLRTGTENDTVWVEVSDTGKGIMPEHLSKIFDPFFTTKPVGKGTGLGLSVSYSIIKKHNGEIKVDSRQGEGATFRVILPVDSSAEK